MSRAGPGLGPWGGHPAGLQDAQGRGRSRERAQPPSSVQDAPRCGSLSRPLSGPRPAPSAAGFPLTRTWGLQQPRVGARGRRTGGAGLGRGRRKGETAALMASGSEEGHLSSRPLSRAPLPRPCTGPGRGPGCHLGGTCLQNLGLDPAWSPPELPPPLATPRRLAGSVLNTGNLGRPKSKSARFIQENSAERFLRVGGGSRGVSQES